MTRPTSGSRLASPGLLAGPAAALAVLLVLLGGCSGDSGADGPNLAVDLTVDVCSVDTCFAAVVPDAEVAITGGGQDRRVTTDRDGLAELDLPPGQYEATATWGALTTGPAAVTVGDGSSLFELSLHFPGRAEVGGSTG